MDKARYGFEQLAQLQGAVPGTCLVISKWQIFRPLVPKPRGNLRVAKETIASQFAPTPQRLPPLGVVSIGYARIRRYLLPFSHPLRLSPPCGVCDLWCAPHQLSMTIVFLDGHSPEGAPPSGSHCDPFNRALMLSWLPPKGLSCTCLVWGARAVLP